MYLRREDEGSDTARNRYSRDAGRYRLISRLLDFLGNVSSTEPPIVSQEVV